MVGHVNHSDGETDTQPHSTDLTEIIKKHTFVGIVDDYRCLSLIQHATKLYLLNHAALAYVDLP